MRARPASRADYPPADWRGAEKRKGEAERIRQKYPERIPVRAHPAPRRAR